ncbi:MAG: hypothetical protein CBB68_13345 [Rhodospirillaceae bacterium TMED8]|nr:transporter [Magnetovibrio sp.]OUT48547.1 MAG: hypothetical protein CBB68_13345 [Rhodospirillaceae bacterium TMED8]|tara:strand:- start:742 stop:1689 length:948 start_codon:yes stop_codon:yes gene_type:complete
MGPIFDIVLPIFVIILTGYIAGRCGLLNESGSEALNRFVYYVALPIMLFSTMAVVDPQTIFNWPFLAAYLGGGLITFLISIVASRLIFRNPRTETSLFGLSGIFGNTGYMGIPLVYVAFGENGQTLAVIATVSQGVFMIPIILIMLESGRNNKTRSRSIRFGVIARVVAFNPLILAPVLGILWSVTGMALPPPIKTFCSILGPAAGPCALFALGLFMVGKPVSEGMAEVSIMVVLKLIIYPVSVGVMAYGYLDLPPLTAAVAVLLAALPTGANCFVLAQNYRVFVHRASSVILVSTAVAVLTVSLLFASPYFQIR